MTLQDAKRNMRKGVVYTPSHGKKEYGVITSVNDKFVFVAYNGELISKATRAEDLEVLHEQV